MSRRWIACARLPSPSFTAVIFRASARHATASSSTTICPANAGRAAISEARQRSGAKSVRRAAFNVFLPANRVFEAIVAPEQFAVDDETRRAENAEGPGLCRGLGQIGLSLGGIGEP